VGDSASATISLYETQKDDSMKNIALSHPWGVPPHFCTFTSNIEEHKQSIDFAKLPNTFQNAVSVTRELGYQYLWIDSICIIQGPDGDFNKEAKRMEDVFSSAYCVLAASSANGQSDGFLKKRYERDYRHFTFAASSTTLPSMFWKALSTGGDGCCRKEPWHDAQSTSLTCKLIGNAAAACDARL
jgi:hypothetical protein